MMQWFVWLKNGVCALLVDGQGNFGSVDGIAQQQCVIQETRMRKISEEIMADIEKRNG
jgi:DNA gyrase subunit A